MLNEDILRLVFPECNLNTGIALSQTNSLCRTIFHSLDDSWYKSRVLERVPWFTPDETQTWKECAWRLRTRSRDALSAHNSDHLLLVKDLNVAMSLCHNDPVFVSAKDIARDENLRHGMVALFEDKVDTGVLGDYKLEGTHLVGLHMDLDLRTMLLSASDFDMDEEEAREVPRNRESVSQSGLKVRHAGNGWVLVVDENEKLLQVRMNTVVDGIVGAEDVIVHKATHPRAPDGALLMDPNPSGPRLHSKDFHTIGLINLIPGSGGALMMKYSRSNPASSYIAYVEPTSELPTVVLCTIPSPFDSRMGKERCFQDADMRFYTAYNGYLYVFIHGRFIQLWVDLGYKMQLDRCLGDCEQWSVEGNTKSRALTVWNKNFAAMGTMSHAHFDHLHWVIVRGRAGHERFVTLDGMGGCVVGDLKTGKTYIALDTLSKGSIPPQMAIAYVTGDEELPIGFYTLDSAVCQQVGSALAQSYERELMVGRTRPLTMEGAFRDWVQLNQERFDMEKRFNVSRGAGYRNVVGDGLYLLTRGQEPLNEIYLTFRKEPLGPKNLSTRSHFKSVDSMKPLRRIVNSQTKKCTLWDCRGH